MILPFCHFSPLHLCIASLNVAVVKRWAEIASPKETSEAIDIPSSSGTALCVAAALKKGRETGKK
jgi:E3 ubiquitin-protein ligase KEG